MQKPHTLPLKHIQWTMDKLEMLEKAWIFSQCLSFIESYCHCIKESSTVPSLVPLPKTDELYSILI